MPNPNAIVGRVERLEPTLAQSPRGERSLLIGGEQRTRLDPNDEKSEGFARVLDGIARLDRPIYVEIEPATRFIRRVLLPDVGNVVETRTLDDALGVLLDASHAFRVLRSSSPDFGAFSELLRRSGSGLGTPLIVTFEGDGTIIDVREFRPGPDGDLPPFPKRPFPAIDWLKDLLRKIWLWPIWPWRWWWWFGCVSGSTAQQVFDAMAATSCNPSNAPAPCIPFRYPTDGCFARAHEMARLMINMGYRPKKVWIKGALQTPTKNDPDCYVWWGWHVAPTLCVRKGFFWTERMVIDPSLFTTPVSKATWKSVQGDPSATLTDTIVDYYFYAYGISYDPSYVQTNSHLAFYRLQLLSQTASYGPAPYAFCP